MTDKEYRDRLFAQVPAPRDQWECNIAVREGDRCIYYIYFRYTEVTRGFYLDKDMKIAEI